jgi:CubicO group peptidase (beta-lactamase class C family)
VVGEDSRMNSDTDPSDCRASSSLHAALRRREFLALCGALPAAIHCAAQAASEGVVDYLAALIREGIAPGAALVASRRGRVKRRRAIGTCCLVERRDAPLTLDTLHPLYSFSKLITGTVVAISVTEGKLNYSDLVSKFIPEFAGGGKDGITIRHCLTHSAGLSKAQSKAVHDSAGWAQALQSLCSATAEWPPGTQTAYHGWSGAFLAAECVRRVNSGKPWAELCRERLFRPLAARSLTYDLPGRDANVAVVPQPATGAALPKTAAAAFGYAGQPGAGCFGTLEDALKVLHLHLHRGVWNSKPLISPAVFQEMHSVQYAGEIAAAQAAGKTPQYESWGLGPLLRGTGPVNGGHQWFGFAHQTEPGIFGHAGIDTLIGVGDLKRQVAFVFATTNSPKPGDKTAPLRNKITDLVFAELG